MPLAIEFFTDDFGPPPGRWSASSLPVPLCSMQAARPAGISADQFRQAVSDAAATWNSVDAGVGVRYSGDCAGGSTRWQFRDDRNEIGFDDERNFVRGSQAGVTRGTWNDVPPFGAIARRDFAEFDIVIAPDVLGGLSARCLQSVITHEMGHMLGFGHSTSVLDLMYPSFDPGNAAGCITAPGSTERTRLQELYGVDGPPTVSAGLDRVVGAGASVTLSASGQDPEGKPVTFMWRQVAGPAVTLSNGGAGAGVSFTAPATADAMQFQVTASDPLLHSARATVRVSVGVADRRPSLAPSFESFLPGGVGGAAIGWSPSDGATSYRFCSVGREAAVTPLCHDVATPAVTVDWPLVLGSQGLANVTRVFTDAVRQTSLAGCNQLGCSPIGAGPLAGGLRWAAWGMDFSYFAMAYDFGDIRYTLVGVVNVSGADRVFTFNTGPADDPDQQRIGTCGFIPAGGACFNYLGPGQQQYAVVSIVTTAPGTPTTAHRVTVR